MPKMWMICLIIFTAYSIYAILSFLPPYMVSVYGMSKNFSVQIGGIRYIIQFAGGITGGFLADKIGSRIKTVLLGVYGHYCISDCVPAYTAAAFTAMLCVFDFILLNVTVYAVRAYTLQSLTRRRLTVLSQARFPVWHPLYRLSPDVFCIP